MTGLQSAAYYWIINFTTVYFLEVLRKETLFQRLKNPKNTFAVIVTFFSNFTDLQSRNFDFNKIKLKKMFPVSILRILKIAGRASALEYKKN